MSVIYRRALQSWTYSAVGLVGAVPIMFLPQLIFHHRPPAGDAGYMTATIVCMAAALAWALWFAIAGFRRAEEFVQERSRFAWYWGSLIGICIVGPIFALIALGGAPWVVSGREAAHAFGLGMLMLLVAQLAGFVVMTAWWRATKR